MTGLHVFTDTLGRPISTPMEVPALLGLDAIQHGYSIALEEEYLQTHI